jgi:hypothetical protein
VLPITRPILLTILAQLQPGVIPGHMTLYGPSMPPTASVTPVSYALARSPLDQAKMRASTSPATPLNSSPILTTARTLISPSRARKPTPSTRGSPSPSQPLLTNLRAPPLPPNASTWSCPALGAPPSSKALTGNHSTIEPLSQASATHSPPPALTAPDSQATAFVAAPPRRPPPPGSTTTKSSFSATGAATRTSCTSKTPSHESYISPDNSTWLIPTPPLSNLRLFGATHLWLESDP